MRFNDKMIFWGGELQKNYEMEIHLNIKSKKMFETIASKDCFNEYDDYKT